VVGRRRAYIDLTLIATGDMGALEGYGPGLTSKFRSNIVGNSDHGYLGGRVEQS